MANVRAFRSGNWSDTNLTTSPWSNGTALFAPASNDDVWAYGYTITIDQNITVLSLRNVTSVSQSWKDGGAAAASPNGGGYAMPVAYNITATNSMNVGNATLLSHTATSGTTTLTCASITAGATSNINTINKTGAGTLEINNASITNTTIGTWVIYCTSGSTVFNNCPTITTAAFNDFGVVYISTAGSATFNSCTISGGTYRANGVQNSGICNLNSCTVNAQVSGNSTSILNNSTGTLNAGNSTFTGIGALNNTGGTVQATNCTFTASSSGTPFASTSGINIVSGYFYDSASGYPAIYLYKWRMGVPPTNGIWRIALNGSSTYVNLYTADNNLNQANPTDVRTGVSYASGSLTGTLTVPSEGTVSNGVTVGPLMPFTATRSSTTATATLAYSYPYVAGDTIVVTGASNAEWNGTYTIASVISGTSITFTVPVTYSSTAGTGAQIQTVGTAMLTAAAIFNTLTSTMTTSGSIGERLANVSTVAVTGQQITSALG